MLIAKTAHLVGLGFRWKECGITLLCGPSKRNQLNRISSACLTTSAPMMIPLRQRFSRGNKFRQILALMHIWI
jgi:hypothetical protein